MRLTLDIKKSLEENAAKYFEAAKKAKKKLEGAQEIVQKLQHDLSKLEQKEANALESFAKERTEQVPKKWYHKFRWFLTSDGMLVVGGRDVTTNEIVIKKHVDKDDLIFHTSMAGSPFFVLKTEGKKPSEAALREVADATVTFSRAWKLGMGAEDVFYVTPEQVSKQAKAGEYLTKGAFMIYGKKSFVQNTVNCAVGKMESHELMAGPLSAVAAHCKEYVRVFQGDMKVSEIAKKIKKKIGGDLDTIIRVLPAGECKL